MSSRVFILRVLKHLCLYKTVQKTEICAGDTTLGCVKWLVLSCVQKQNHLLDSLIQ